MQKGKTNGCPTSITLSDAEPSKVSHREEGGSLSLLSAFTTSVTSSFHRQGSEALTGMRRRNHGGGKDQWKLRAMADY